MASDAVKEIDGEEIHHRRIIDLPHERTRCLHDAHLQITICVQHVRGNPGDAQQGRGGTLASKAWHGAQPQMQLKPAGRDR